MSRILHLSDIHIGHKTRFSRKKRTNKNLKKIVKEIVGSKEIDDETTAIVITGDIAHDAVKEDYKFLAKEFNANLGGYNIFMVPGNHDYRPPGSKYTENAVDYFNDEFRSGENTTYPVVDIFKELVLVGLDSFEGKFVEGVRNNSKGMLGQSQLKELKKLLVAIGAQTDRKIVIYFHHHPFRGNNLLDAESSERDNLTLKDIIEEHNLKREMISKIACLLYGHNHNGFDDSGNWGVERCYDGSSSTKRNKSKTAIQRLVDFNKKPSSDIQFEWV